MNVNADQAAVAVAGALDAELVLLSDVSGVLDGKGHLIATLDAKQADALIAKQSDYRRHDRQSESGIGSGARFRTSD